jgi:hypothetical protein
VETPDPVLETYRVRAKFCDIFPPDCSTREQVLNSYGLITRNDCSNRCKSHDLIHKNPTGW